jgi:hypothetical protein
MDLKPPVFAPIILMKLLWQSNSVIIGDDRHRKMVKASLRFLGEHFGMKFCCHLGSNEDWCETPLFSIDPANYAVRRGAAEVPGLSETFAKVDVAS